MNTRTSKLIAFTCTAVLAVGVAMAWAQDAGDARKINTLRITPDQARAIIWNPDNIEAAKALPLPLLKRDSTKTRKRAAIVPPSLESGRQQSADAEVQTKSNNKIPIKWEGKVFFSKPGEGNYVCSGQFITDNVIMTAAHCVQNMETGQWYENFQFHLQYNAGRAATIHTPECVGVYQGWVSGPENYEWDYALVLVDMKSPVGHLGYHFGWRNEYAKAKLTGYPADIAAGQRIQLVDGTLNPAPMGEVNIISAKHKSRNFQGGASGGAWIGKYSSKAGKNNYVIGINSFGYEGEPYVMYSPYLTEDFRKLLRYAQNGCRE